MSFKKHLTDARESHLAHLDALRQEGPAELDAFQLELALRLGGDTPFIGNFYIFDMAGIDDSRVCLRRAESDHIRVGKAVETEMGMRIRVDGLRWDAMVFKTLGGSLPMDHLTTWFERWFGGPDRQSEVPGSLMDIHGYFQPHHAATGLRAHLPRFARRMLGRGVEVGAPDDVDDFHGFIHGVVVQSEREITVDFGAASLRAFAELVTVLAQSDAEEIFIKSARDDRTPYHLALDLLQERHEKESGTDPASASDAFFAWFAENAASLAGRMEEMRTLGIDENGNGLDQATSIRNEILLELSPRIEAVDEGLDVDISSGKNRPNALIVGAGGDPGLMQSVRDLVARAPDIPTWEIVAFRPAAPLKFSLCVDIPCHGRFTIDPSEISVSLRPRFAKIDVALHFKDIDPAMCLVLEEPAKQAVLRVIGELAFLEGVGRVSAETLCEDSAGTVALNDLGDAFAAAVTERRDVLEGLRARPDAERIDANLSLLESEINAFERVLEEFGEIETVRIQLEFWSPDASAAETIDDALPDFEINEQKTGSLAGAGWSITAVGECPVAHGVLRTWLAETLAPIVAEGTILVAVFEFELYIEGMIEELDQKASELIEADHWAEAAQIMRPLVARFGDIESGRLHAKTGLCYLKGGHYAIALKFYTEALESLTEKDWKSETLSNAGVCYQSLGQVDAAIDHYRRALDFDPDNATRQYNLGQGYALIADSQNACIHLRRAAELDAAYARMIMEDPDLEAIRASDAFIALANDLAA